MGGGLGKRRVGRAGMGGDEVFHGLLLAGGVQRLFHGQQGAGEGLLETGHVLQTARAVFAVERLAAQGDECVQRLIGNADHARAGSGGDVPGHQRPGGKIVHLGGHGLAQGLFVDGKGAHGLLDGDARVQTALCQRHHAEIVGGEELFAALAHGDEGAAVRELRNLPGGQPAAARGLVERHALAWVGRVGFVDGVEQFQLHLFHGRGLHQPLDDGERIVALALQPADRGNGVYAGAVVIGHVPPGLARRADQALLGVKLDGGQAHARFLRQFADAEKFALLHHWQSRTILMTSGEFCRARRKASLYWSSLKWWVTKPSTL